MLKVNERLDKLAATWADFTARGMLADSCLIQAIRNAFSEDISDKEVYDSDETDSDAPDKIHTLDPDRPNTHLPNNTDTRTLDNDNTDVSALDNMNPRSLDNANTRALDNTSRHSLDDFDDDHHHPRNQDSHTPPDNEEDDNHGPIELGPLMNEVRLGCKKGQAFSVEGCITLTLFTAST